MDAYSLPLSALMTAAGQDQQIQAAVREQRGRLLRFIERRVPDPTEAEDIL
ncbi:MAG: RNA polymerase subunit sigma-24, partial [Hymenobacter sp.]